MATTTLRASQYRRRVVDFELDELLTGASAVALEGAKGVGKSATAAEWQHLPFTWDLVRRAVDAGAKPGQLGA